ncbi:hypothetical protein F336_020 [Campylobacter phage F336]|uniref:Uncharacterized protein n=1 Tax=Campylobacter phage F336 TaxID=2794361 RepID=A0A7T3KD01_9CAUD|nr:hypothetical protein F336_020 [Campylobacter phage F336]
MKGLKMENINEFVELKSQKLNVTDFIEKIVLMKMS